MSTSKSEIAPLQDDAIMTEHQTMMNNQSLSVEVDQNEVDYCYDFPQCVDTPTSTIKPKINAGPQLPGVCFSLIWMADEEPPTKTESETETDSNASVITVAVEAPYLLVSEDSVLSMRYSGILPKQSPSMQGRPLLVLDLDETLVHACTQPISAPDICCTTSVNGVLQTFYVRKRPNLQQFLSQASKKWEICIFTASISQYANQVIDQLDPQHETIHHRLFRENCTFYEGYYVKDLSRLGRPLERIVIIDNSPQSYMFHPQNAVSIVTWYSDPFDTALLDLLPWLETQANEPVLSPCTTLPSSPFFKSSSFQSDLQFPPDSIL